MTPHVVTTTEVGSWMEDLGDHFADIIEDPTGRAVRPAAVDEHGTKWTYDRISEVTGIPKRTVERMVRKSRSGTRDAASRDQTPDERARSRLAAERNPASAAAGIGELAPVEKERYVGALLQNPETRSTIMRLASDERRHELHRFTGPDLTPPRTVLSDLNDELSIDHHIRRARNEIQQAIRHARNVTLDDEARRDAILATRELLVDINMLTDAIDTDSLNDELATLLGGNQ